MTAEPPNGQTIPPEMQAVADEFNAWCELLGTLGPLPVRFAVASRPIVHNTKDGPKHAVAVRLIAIKPDGPTVLFLTPDLADELAGLLVRYATEARSGITVVRNPGAGPTILEEGSPHA